VAALSLLAIATVLSVSCGRSTLQPEAEEIDRPIVITGGSLELDFNHADYADSTGCTGAPPAMSRYCSADNQITAITIWDNKVEPAAAVCPNSCPGGNCTMTLTYNKVTDSTVTIKSDAVNKTIYLEFNKLMLPAHPSSTRRHYSLTATLKSVVITDDSSSSSPPPKTCELGEGAYSIEILGLRR